MFFQTCEYERHEFIYSDKTIIMNSMKIVVYQNGDTRKVINTDLERELIFMNRCSQYRSYAAAPRWARIERYRYNSFREIPQEQRYIRYTACRKRSRIKKWTTRYHTQRDLAIAKEKLARLSVNISTEEKDGSVKNSVAPSAIQLRKPVLQFSRSYEKPSSTNTNDVSSTSTEKTDQLAESILEIYKCRMCPNLTVPEVYECPSGHLVCIECSLVLGDFCTLCTDDESSFRRVLGMERIASFLKFPCRWYQRGCLELLDSIAWRNHVDTCRHAEVQFSSASRVGSSLDYEIDNVDEFSESNRALIG